MRRLCCVLALVPALAGSAGTLVQFRTTVGHFDVELFDADKPVTVSNFLRYIRTGLYTTNLIFHRGVTNFVVQGGGVRVADDTSPHLEYVPTFLPIPNEFRVGRFISNTYGTIAMAKSSDPDSATSQFFFNLANNSASLDNTNNSGGFTVFGRVLSGTNNLDRLNPGLPDAAIKIVNVDNGVLAELPVLKTANSANLTLNDLIYSEISLFNVQVRSATNGFPEISWNSVAGKTNTVEFATTLPLVWRVLASTNGTGATVRFTDVPTSANRFYRVRVDY
jgi:cyclophilin family peptidyl-prolyl cis-trans isomerase